MGKEESEVNSREETRGQWHAHSRCISTSSLECHELTVVPRATEVELGQVTQPILCNM